MYSRTHLIALCVAALCVSIAFSRNILREKREAHILSDGIDSYLTYNPSFTCSAAGYFADMANDCRFFHICLPQEFPDGKSQLEQYTFACPNQTVFNQFSLTCAHEAEAVPCASSGDFFYLNERIGNPSEFIHTDEDVAKWNTAIGRE